MSPGPFRAVEASTRHARSARVEPRVRRALRAGAVALVVLSLLGACSSPAPAKRLQPTRTGTGVTYWSGGGSTLRLDSCLPDDHATDRRAVVLVHGGGFTDGDKSDADMVALCHLVAQLGVAAFSIDYRLAPAHVFPSQVDDLAHAVGWLREPAQVKRYGIDPAHIGVIGSSAGAIMAQTLGTRGSGSLQRGTRVSAVVSLSGVSVMTPDALTLGSPTPQAAQLILSYLGCASVERSCPQAARASSITAVDRTDAPMLLVNGSSELVPREQPEAMAARLRSAGVSERLVIVDGSKHGAALVNSAVRTDIQTFLEEHL